MRFVFDLQPCQSGSRFRGIGRSCLELSKEIAKLAIKDKNEVIILLNGSIKEGTNFIEKYLSKNLPSAKIHKFFIPLPSKFSDIKNNCRQFAAEMLREISILTLSPDILHISQIAADGWDDDTIVSINTVKKNYITSLLHHDLIPLANPLHYLQNKRYKNFYLKKIKYINKADIIFSISEFSKNELKQKLNIPLYRIKTISSGITKLKINKLSSKEIEMINNYNLGNKFILYVPGGFDFRKNFENCIKAYDLAQKKLNISFKIVIASKGSLDDYKKIISLLDEIGLKRCNVIFTGYVTDSILQWLYSNCYLFIFPSLHEGFGLPILEAMHCGAPVIASNCSAIPEIVRKNEALFDPFSVKSIKNKIEEVFLNPKFRSSLIKHSKKNISYFSWDYSAKVAYNHMKKIYNKKKSYPIITIPSYKSFLDSLKKKMKSSKITKKDFKQILDCYNENIKKVENTI